MSETYMVQIDHEEENEDQLSITGVVNGFQCAVVLNKRTMTQMSKKERAAYKDRELVKAFLSRKPAIASAGREVTL